MLFKQNNINNSIISEEVVKGIRGFKLDSYLIALEGWRRGLNLTWYKDESGLFTMNKYNLSSTLGNFYSLNSKSKKHHFFRSQGDKVDIETVGICKNKEKTKRLLKGRNIPVPEGQIYDIKDDIGITSYANKIGYPVVIKPLTGSMGQGVFTDIKNELELRNIISLLKTKYKYKKYIIEKHYIGKEYRVYVVGNKVVGAINRIPANIRGDGQHSIKELIKLKNKWRKRNPYLARKPIKIDYEIKQTIKNEGYNLDSVLEKGKTLYLRKISNLSAGGDSISATDELSKKVKRIAVKSLKALPSIPHAGVDIIVDPENKHKCVVLEINATAEISFHVFPQKGQSQDVPGAIIDYYFPETKRSKKHNYYFDFLSVLEPLKSWSVEKLDVANPMRGKLFARKFIVEGKVYKVGYMNWIRRRALKSKFYGSAKLVSENQVEIIIYGKDRKEMKEFYYKCKKGPKKSRVDKVITEELEISWPIKMGFEIIT